MYLLLDVDSTTCEELKKVDLILIINLQEIQRTKKYVKRYLRDLIRIIHTMVNSIRIKDLVSSTSKCKETKYGGGGVVVVIDIRDIPNNLNMYGS